MSTCAPRATAGPTRSGAKRMYYLVNNSEFGGHLLQLYALEPGLSLYSFTFGNNCENKFAHR